MECLAGFWSCWSWSPAGPPLVRSSQKAAFGELPKLPLPLAQASSDFVGALPTAQSEDCVVVAIQTDNRRLSGQTVPPSPDDFVDDLEDSIDDEEWESIPDEILAPEDPLNSETGSSDSTVPLLMIPRRLEDEFHLEDSAFGNLPPELSSLQFLPFFTVQDMCSFRASCRQFSPREVLVDHLAYLVSAARPEVFLAMGHVSRSGGHEKLHVSGINDRHALRDRLNALDLLLFGRHLTSWWQTKPEAIRIVESLRAYSYRFETTDGQMQSYLVQDFLHIAYSEGADGDTYFDPVWVCKTMEFWPHRSGLVYDKCVAVLRQLEQSTNWEQEETLHQAATTALDKLTPDADV